jgi:ubiquinone/menaquinone biosynthesis C-methylase UbiE
LTYILEHSNEALRLELQKEIEAYSIHSELEGVGLNNKNILDAGCGGGDVSEFLISNSTGSNVHGCDQSEIRVAHAKKKNPTGHFFTSSLECIDAEDNSFDLIVCRYVFEYLKDPIAVLEEFKRVCKKGGEVIVIDIDGVFQNLFTINESFNQQLSKLVSTVDVDLEVGRKLPAYFKKAGFESFTSKMDSYYFKGDDLKLEVENSKMRLSAINKDISRILGEEEGLYFIRNYLRLLEKDSSVMFFNKFIVRGLV